MLRSAGAAEAPADILQLVLLKHLPIRPGAGADVSDILLFSGFQTFREDRKAARRGRKAVRGGGLAVIIRDDIAASKLSVTSTGDSRLETLWLAVSAPGGRAAVLGVAYRPPDSPAAADVDELRQQLLEVSASGKPIYLLGDINMDLMRPDKPHVTLYSSMIDELGFNQLIRDPTHPGATPSLLDHVLTNQTTTDHESAVIKTHVSDHDLITVKTRLGRQKHEVRCITTRSMRRVNHDQLSLDLLLADWSALEDEAACIDDIYKAFLDVWNEVVDKHCPLKRVKLRHQDRPWLTINEELQELQTRRDIGRRKRDALRTAASEREYADLKKEFKRRIAQARADYFSAPSSAKEMWSQLRKHALGPKQGKGPTSVMNQETASRFNTYFSGVGRRVADELEGRSAPRLTPRPPIVCSSAFKVRAATLTELSSALKRMSGSRAVGYDGVSLQLIARCFPVVGPHVLRVINRSLVTGKVPTLWKYAKVIPIHKAGDVSQPCNFRPISILSVVSKLAEKLVSTQLMTYLTDNHVLSPSQYAYRPNHSTESATVDLVSRITANNDEGLVTCLSSCDLSKAFDCVNRGALLTKLQWYGISTHWFADYFSNRTQAIDGGCSLPVPYGVVQGSTIGAIMFSLFTNDLPCHLSRNASLISYADDSQILHSAPPTQTGLTELRLRTETDLSTLSAWFCYNRLKINPDKTELILFGTTAALKKTTDFSISFEGAQLTPAQSVKILGVIFDRELSMHQQTSRVVQRCYSSLITISKIRDTLPKTTVHLVRSLVFPHVTYCLPAWAPPTKRERLRMEKVVNYAARVVTRKRKFDHISRAKRELGWLSFEHTNDYRDCARPATRGKRASPPKRFSRTASRCV